MTDIPESVDRRRVRWLCRRGMKELDVLLEDFFQRRFEQLTLSQQTALVRLLELPDPQVRSLLLNESRASDDELKQMVALIRSRA